MKKQLIIMLIDDNGIDLFLHQKLISLQPYVKTVIKFLSATESISFLENTAIEKWPDVILLDIHMPIYDGFAFLHLYNHLPIECRNKCNIVMVTSSLNIEDILLAKANPHVLNVLIKPLSMPDLEKILLPKFSS